MIVLSLTDYSHYKREIAFNRLYDSSYPHALKNSIWSWKQVYKLRIQVVYVYRPLWASADPNR